jgi:hypothetical protein
MIYQNERRSNDLRNETTFLDYFLTLTPSKVRRRRRRI